MPLSDVHNCKGKHVVYVLRCDPTGTEYPSLWYVGQTIDWERRLLQHGGKCPGGAIFTKAHVPIGIESVQICKDAEEATFMEVGLWNLLAAKHGFQAVRGARMNQDCGMMKYAPRGWKDEESSPKEETTKEQTTKEETADDLSTFECPKDPQARELGIGLRNYCN